MGPTMTTTLAVANQKGGVGKTTSVASIGAALVELGQRVLLVDLDPQACLTFSLGIDPEDLELSVHHVLTKGLSPTEVIVATDDGVHLLPATKICRGRARPPRRGPARARGQGGARAGGRRRPATTTSWCSTARRPSAY